MRFKRTVASRRWTPLAASLAMFALLCATIAYWALQLFSPAVPIAPAGSLADQRDVPDLVAAGRLFGMPVGGRGAAQVAVVSSIQVLGVAASEVRGSAVLVVDGKPPKAFMVGDAVGADAKLVEVRSDAAIIERNGARVELPAPQRPSVATLSSGPARADANSAAVAPPVPTAAAAPPPTVAAPPPPAAGPINGRSPGPTRPAPAQPEATGAPAAGQPGAPAQQPAAVADQPGPASR
ncbi:MAG: type II secretion system protein N [Burkholderiaceae bacterium]